MTFLLHLAANYVSIYIVLVFHCLARMVIKSQSVGFSVFILHQKSVALFEMQF